MDFQEAEAFAEEAPSVCSSVYPVDWVLPSSVLMLKREITQNKE